MKTLCRDCEKLFTCPSYSSKTTDCGAYKTIQPKSQIKKIIIERLEGKTKYCGIVHNFIPTEKKTAIEQCNDILQKWGMDAPKKGHGYDKCRYSVIWENGHEYTGRFCLQEGGTDNGTSFQLNLKQSVLYYAGKYTPPHMTPEQYEDNLKYPDPGCLEISNTCII